MPQDPKPDSHLTIAILFIGGFFAFLLAAFAYFWVTGSEVARTFVGTLFGGWVGVIVGFYFGQKPAEDATEQLRVPLDRNAQLVDWTRNVADSAMAKLGIERLLTPDE